MIAFAWSQPSGRDRRNIIWRRDAGEGIIDGSYRALTGGSYISKSDRPHEYSLVADGTIVLHYRF